MIRVESPNLQLVWGPKGARDVPHWAIFGLGKSRALPKTLAYNSDWGLCKASASTAVSLHFRVSRFLTMYMQYPSWNGLVQTTDYMLGYCKHYFKRSSRKRKATYLQSIKVCGEYSRNYVRYVSDILGMSIERNLAEERTRKRMVDVRQTNKQTQHNSKQWIGLIDMSVQIKCLHH